MIQIASPFISQIPYCKKSMKKLRKKIYKYTTSKSYLQKRKEPSFDDVISILNTRNIPEFVLESLKKKRNFDLCTFNNINVGQRSPLSDLAYLTNQQEQQIKTMYIENKKKIHERRRLPSLIKLQRRNTSSTSISSEEYGTISSTNPEDQMQSQYDQSESGMFFEQRNKQENVFDVEPVSQDGLFSSNYLDLDSNLDSQQNLFRF